MSFTIAGVPLNFSSLLNSDILKYVSALVISIEQFVSSNVLNIGTSFTSANKYSQAVLLLFNLDKDDCKDGVITFNGNVKSCVDVYFATNQTFCGEQTPALMIYSTAYCDFLTFSFTCLSIFFFTMLLIAKSYALFLYVNHFIKPVVVWFGKSEAKSVQELEKEVAELKQEIKTAETVLPEETGVNNGEATTEQKK